ncbi:A disintegrin and metalloproteinase with thrombospondin motifs adt-2-like isoform X2 [Linepithema humile]|uniref:A disintegrin and metalloproteinase with thrombospondin motifs adt-2-like isoform X2 n=1 Tax=Linepithema humile TaxID=83485 RepID=UPI0006238DBC|nr:PREDICTED: A disintegrin and metalloproteinase with thrombospondin motifs 7-like isoform X2 [Linepithema humile]
MKRTRISRKISKEYCCRHGIRQVQTKYIQLTLKVFGTQIQLNLHRSNQTVSSTFEVWKYGAKSITEGLSQLNASNACYYLHKDHISTAIMNFCQEFGWEGFVFLKDDTLVIRPLRDDLASSSLIDNLCVKEEMNISFGKPHCIKRLLQSFADSSFDNLDNLKLKPRHVRNTEEKLTVELGVFIDEAAYRTFMPFLKEDKEMLRLMILAYVNNIQALYHHPSLGVSIDISLVYLEIMQEQLSNLSVFGSAKKLLNSFCKYAKSVNPPDDNDPQHWDVGLYLTGINIYSMSNYIMGRARTNSVCDLVRSCAIVEFGVTGEISSGFASSVNAAHEIGHVLGMVHDTDNSTPGNTYKYIMSSSKLHQGQVTWSKCSHDVAEKLWNTKMCLRDRTRQENLAYDHSIYHDLPGREWTAKAQCEVYFRDKNANAVSLLDICKTLRCEVPHEKRHKFTGPALEGTTCELGKECRGGECVPVIEPPYIFHYCKNDNWSEWEEGACQSNCLEKSKGVKVKRRFCTHNSRRTAFCGGSYYDVVLCNDSMLCTKHRMTTSEFTTTKCIIFSSIISRTVYNHIKLKAGPGVQVSHNVSEPWMACAIHCKQKNSSALYAPRLELLSYDIDPYFPDGTWCHHKDGQDYYCRQHYCLPEIYS